MSFRQIKTLVVACEHGSFAAAADALNLTQSAVSMQIAALEKSLGLTLFDRRFRPAKLTRQGLRILEQARPVVMQYDRMVDEISGELTVQNTFRLGVIPTVLTNLMPAALLELRSQRPELTINVSSGLSGRLHRLVGTGELDGAVMHKPDDIADSFHWSDIARQTVKIIAPADSTGGNAEEVFLQLPYIRFGSRAWVAPMIDQRFAALGIEPHASAEIESIEAIQIMVGLGFGASVIPVASAGGPATPGIRMLEFGSPQLFRTIGLLTRIDTRKKSERRIVGDAFVEIAGRPLALLGQSFPDLSRPDRADPRHPRASPQRVAAHET